MIYQIQYSKLYSLANTIRDKTNISSTFAFPDDFISVINNIKFFDYNMASTVLVFNNNSKSSLNQPINANSNLVFSNSMFTIWPSNYYTYCYIDLPRVITVPSISSVPDDFRWSLKFLKLLQCQEIGSNAFQKQYRLATVILPKCSYIRKNAFEECHDLKQIQLSKCTIIEDRAFYDCNELTQIGIPNCIDIGKLAFYYATKLSEINLSNCINIGDNAFEGCWSIQGTIDLQKCETIGTSAFAYCSKIDTIKLYNINTIPSSCFTGCRGLKSLYLYNSTIIQLSNYDTLNYTPMLYSTYLSGTYGSIYVPSDLLSSYQQATLWTYFSSRFVAL